MENKSLPETGLRNPTAEVTVRHDSNLRYRQVGNRFGLAERTGTLLVCIALCSLVLAVLVMSAVPPVSRDALTHHLAVPKIWIKKGGIAAIPHLPYSYYPMNLNLLYTLPMLLGNDIFPKYIHFFFGLATAWLIYTYLKTRVTPMLALDGVLLFLSTPVVFRLSTSAYVDLGLVFFSWAAMVQFMKWFHAPQKLKHLVIAALFVGMGLGTKYNGLISLVLLTLFVPIAYIHYTGREQAKVKLAIGYAVLFLVIALMVFSPWMVRNASLTGNPIYPLFNKRIGIGSQTNEISNQSMKPWLQRKLIYGETVLETAAIPLRIFFQGQDDNPRYFDGQLNPLLCLLPLLLLIQIKDSDEKIKRERFFLSFYSILFILFASFMVDMRIRYIAPVIPPLVVLSVLGIDRGLQWAGGFAAVRVRGFVCSLIAISVVVGLGMNARYVAGLFKFVDPVPYVLGDVSREDYLRKFLPEYDAVQFANRIVSDDGKILALFVGKRLYYFDRPTEFMVQGFAKMVKTAGDHSRIDSQIHKHGFSHCIIGIRRFEAWVNQSFNDQQKSMIVRWLKRDCHLLYTKNGFAVFKMAR